MRKANEWLGSEITHEMEDAFDRICGSDCDPSDVDESDVRNAAEMWRQQGEPVTGEYVNLAIRYMELVKEAADAED